MIRVLVVDDDFMVAKVHGAFVGRTAGFEVVGVAHTGAAALDAALDFIEEKAVDLLLGIVERRCVEEANGATWQSRAFRRLYEDQGLDRVEALRRMTVAYRDHMHANEPVHTWPLP